MKKIYSVLLWSFVATYVHPTWNVCNLYNNNTVSATYGYISVMHVATSSQAYSSGGLTFTYPSGLFTSAPIVVISLVYNAATYSNGTTYTAVITANSATSCTVRVHKLADILVTTVGEAATNDVTIQISVFGS